MRSLLIKNLIVYRKILLADTLSILVINIVFHNPSASAGIIALAAMIFLMQSIQIDARAHGDVLVNSLPVSRGAVVRSRYSETILVSLAMFFLVELVAAGLRSTGMVEFPAMGWAHLGGVVTAAVLWSAIILPLYFWLGSVFLPYLSILVFVIAFGVGSAAEVAIRAFVRSESTRGTVYLWAWSRSLAAGEALAWVYLLLVAAVLFAGSMLLSVRLYQRREF